MTVAALDTFGAILSDPTVVAGVVAAAGVTVGALIAAVMARGTQRRRYELEALTRLRGATGTFRLELFLSARSLARRLPMYFKDDAKPLLVREQEGRQSEYHDGGLFIYRLLRSLAVSDLIEQQTYDADLLLDPAMVELLRFNHAAYEMLTGEQLGKPFAGETEAERFPEWNFGNCWDWGAVDLDEKKPFQRLRASYLRTAASKLIVKEPGSAEAGTGGRCIVHHEFRQLWELPVSDAPHRPPGSPGARADANEIATRARREDFHEGVEPIKEVVHDFRPEENPVFWLRLVGYAYTCVWVHDRIRAAVPRGLRERFLGAVPRRLRARGLGKDKLRFAELDLNTEDLLRQARNDYLNRHAGDYKERFDQIIVGAL